MFGDLHWPLNASRGFVSISWVCCYRTVACLCMQSAIPPSVRLSVGKSVTVWYCIEIKFEMNAHIVKLFPLSGEDMNLVLLSEWALQPLPNSKGTPSAKAEFPLSRVYIVWGKVIMQTNENRWKFGITLRDGALFYGVSHALPSWGTGPCEIFGTYTCAHAV